MPYQGRENYHYVEDVGAHFAAAALAPFEGFGVFNIKGNTIGVDEFLEIAFHAAQKLGIAEFCDLGIQPDAAENLFVCDLDDSAIDQAFPRLPRTSISDGIRGSLESFLRMAKAGELVL